MVYSVTVLKVIVEISIKKSERYSVDFCPNFILIVSKTI